MEGWEDYQSNLEKIKVSLLPNEFFLKILWQDMVVKMTVLVAQLYPALCFPMNCSPSGSSVHAVLQARILEWVAVPFSRGSPDPGIEPRSPYAGGFFTV